MVERYNYCEGDEDMCEDVYGAYVSYHDYADLEAESARLREALRECVNEIDFLRIADSGEMDADNCHEAERISTKAREVLGND